MVDYLDNTHALEDTEVIEGLQRHSRAILPSPKTLQNPFQLTDEHFDRRSWTDWLKLRISQVAILLKLALILAVLAWRTWWPFDFAMARNMTS